MPPTWGVAFVGASRIIKPSERLCAGLLCHGVFQLLLYVNLQQVIAVLACYPGDLIFELTPSTRMGALHAGHLKNGRALVFAA